MVKKTICNLVLYEIVN